MYPDSQERTNAVRALATTRSRALRRYCTTASCPPAALSARKVPAISRSGATSASTSLRVISTTRSARVIASVSNEGMTWRPGSYVTAKVTATEDAVDIRLPRTALQTIAGEQVVFVRNERGFEKRIVVIGKSDDEGVEIAFGLDAGEQIALTNTFVLKAELGKAEAEHAH